MGKLTSLLMAIMSGGVQLFRYRGKTAQSRRVVPILLGTLIGLLMFSSTSAMVAGLNEDGLDSSVVLSIYTFLTAIIIVTEGVYKSGDLLFKPRDNDMLLAMPIRKSTIVAARIIKFYAFEMVYCLIFLLPAIIAYAINNEVGASYYLVAISMMLLVPVIPIAISCIVGLITSAISARFRRRTFLQVLVAFVIMLGFAVLVFAVGAIPDSNDSSMMVANAKVTEFYYPAATFASLTTKFSVQQYLIFVAINLLVAVMVVAVIGRFYFQIVSRLDTIKQKSVANAKYDFRRHSQFATIIRKELNRYFNTPVLLVNTAMGLVLFLVAVGVLCFKYDDIVGSLMSSIENFPLTSEEIYSYMPSVALGMVEFASLMTFITATAISLEGKAFNTLKTMPIGGVKVIMAKVFSAVLVIVPVTALGSIVMAIRFQFGILETILVLIAVLATPLVTELIGILIDLKYAKFNAESDAVVVKQSAGVMVATFLGLILVLFTISLLFMVVFLAGQMAGLVMMNAIFMIVALFLYFVVAMRGEEKYMKLSA